MDPKPDHLEVSKQNGSWPVDLDMKVTFVVQLGGISHLSMFITKLHTHLA